MNLKVAGASEGAVEVVVLEDILTPHPGPLPVEGRGRGTGAILG
jgi:hypothetical protein